MSSFANSTLTVLSPFVAVFLLSTCDKMVPCCDGPWVVVTANLSLTADISEAVSDPTTFYCMMSLHSPIIRKRNILMVSPRWIGIFRGSLGFSFAKRGSVRSPSADYTSGYFVRTPVEKSFYVEM